GSARSVGTSSDDALVVPNDASAPAFYGSSNRQKIAVTSIKDKRETLMGHTEKTCCSRDTPARLFQSSPNKVSFIMKDFGIERKAWRQCHVLSGCGCCLVGSKRN